MPRISRACSSKQASAAWPLRLYLRTNSAACSWAVSVNSVKPRTSLKSTLTSRRAPPSESVSACSNSFIILGETTFAKIDLTRRNWACSNMTRQPSRLP